MNSDERNECKHEDVLVDYAHPFGDILGVSVVELQASDSTKTRPIMGLLNPRCAKCGVKLQHDQLDKRICKGGDLHDYRFRWSKLRRVWWKIW